MMKSINRLIIITISMSFLFSQYRSSLKTAKMHELNENWDAAISIYIDIINKYPNNYQAIKGLKNIYKVSHRYNEGIDFLKYSINKNSRDIKSIIELGEFYYLNEEILEAKKTWNEGLNNHNNNKSFYRILLSTYEKYSLDKEIFNLVKKGRSKFNNSFLAQEMGNYFQRRKIFDLALDEYILTLLHSSGNGSSVSRKILMMSDDIDAKNIIEIKLLESSSKYPKILLPILANHYFKHNEYINSYNTYLEWANKGFFNAQKWLNYAKNLRKEKSFKLSIDAYQFALKQNLQSNQIGEALLGLAKTFEEQIHPIEDNNLIPYFYNDNIFFSDSFKLYSELSTENLKTSLAIYDSIVVSIPDSYLMAEAQFRLGEIQFKIIEDYDKAIELYHASLSNNPHSELKKKNVLRIADVLIAKGDDKKSITFLDSVYKKYPSPQIKNKLIEVHLFSGNPDTALVLLDEIFSEINSMSNHFNDLMEIRDMINFYYKEVDNEEKNVFKEFLKIEYLLKQRKIYEANQKLEFIINNNKNSKLTPTLSLRKALILLTIKQYDLALIEINQLEKSNLADKCIILSGQIYEQIFKDNEKALEYYMRIINNYSDSIYFEPIRYHIRKIKT